MLKRVLVANRGEIAVRIIRECLDCSIEAVAVYSTADEYSLHAAIATDSVCIGGPRPQDSYLIREQHLCQKMRRKRNQIYRPVFRRHKIDGRQSFGQRADEKSRSACDARFGRDSKR